MRLYQVHIVGDPVGEHDPATFEVISTSLAEAAKKAILEYAKDRPDHDHPAVLLKISITPVKKVRKVA